MKRGYKKLLVFEIIFFIVILLNSFIINILNDYTLVITLILVTILFKKIFGFEKDKHRYTEDIIFDIIIFLLMFFISFYLFGIIIGFAKTGNYYNLKGIISFIIPITLTIIIKEYLRYQMIMKSEGCKILTITTCILFIFLDITNALYYGNFSTKYDSFIFIALTLMPSISSNIVCMYLSYRVGYKPNIVYLLVINLYQYLIPIIPNPNEYIYAIIKFLLPIILGYKLSLSFNKVMDEDIRREYKKNKSIALILPTFLVIIIIYFTSGYFRYYTVAIASGSMTPKIYKGDVVIIDKKFNRDDLEIGQVIAYEYNQIVVVHRLVNIEKVGDKYYYYTKGDANGNIDNYIVYEDTILGIVNHKIPYVGFPTVWLNEL